jgi:hypothetical protein
VTKGEFRLVALGLAVVLIAAGYHVGSQILGILQGGRGGKSSPILVQGGSMTAFTVNVLARNGWLPKTSNSTAYCVDLDTAKSYIVFVDESLSGNPQSRLLPAAGWEIDIVGNDPSGAGWKFTPQQQDCPGITSTSKTSIVVTTINGAGGFYPTRLPASGNHIDNVRFLDKPTSSVGDEDLWERMSLVSVKAGGVVLTQYPCGDGDCYVQIGPYQ